jgi:hypothetical protein
LILKLAATYIRKEAKDKRCRVCERITVHVLEHGEVYLGLPLLRLQSLDRPQQHLVAAECV